MQEIKFVQTQQTVNYLIWIPIKGNKDFSCHARTELLLPMKSNQILIENPYPYTERTGKRTGEAHRDKYLFGVDKDNPETGSK